MAHIVSDITAPRFSFNLGAIRKFFTNIRAAWAMQANVRATIDELQRLSNKELADLGIHRADITRTAFESVYGEKA